MKKWEVGVETGLQRGKEKKSVYTKIGGFLRLLYISHDMSKTTKIRSFTDLIAWKEAHKLAISIYRKTETFPKSEIFGLTSQIRRAAVSVPSNIAEGFNRQSAKEKVNFYAISQGSVGELESQLLIARDIEFLKTADFKGLADQAVKVHKLLVGLIRSTKSR